MSTAARAMMLAILWGGCATADHRHVRAASGSLSRALDKGDREGILAHLVPGVAAEVDLEPLLVDPVARTERARSLRRPRDIYAESWVMVTPGVAVRCVRTPQGWRFAEDPTDLYAQDTPAHALRALVLASRMSRWDVLLRLAPRRYREGLSQDDLRRAWTEGEQGEALRSARDRLAAHVQDPLDADDDEASLDLGYGRAARLEREGRRWVVADF